MNPLLCGAIATVFCFAYSVVVNPKGFVNSLVCRGLDMCLSIIPATPSSLTVSGLLNSLFGGMTFFQWVILDTLTLLFPILGFWMIFRIIKFVKPFGV